MTTAVDLKAVDVDFHNDFKDWGEVMPHVDQGLQHRLKLERERSLARHGFRKVGGPKVTPATDPAAAERWLEEQGIDRAVLVGNVFSLGVQPNFDLAAALARAINQWTLERWVRPSKRFKGSILVAQQDADQAAEEIDRLGDDPGMVQVVMCSASESPFGRRNFHPIYAACVRHNLPLALHIGGEGAGISAPSTPVGHPNTYVEWYSALPQAYMAHVMSMVSEGVFEKFPTLKVVLLEGGVAWMPHVTWRFNKNFKAVRAEAPWLTKLPAEYIAEHFYLSTYPLEELYGDGALEKILRMEGLERRVMFSSNYPYQEYGDAFEMLAELPDDLRRRVMVENALGLYGERLLS
jgi:predicted TIM-barrel fold metal-dependent hydrolase